MSTKVKRPGSVTILALGVLITAAFFLLRAYQAVQLRSFLQTLDAGVSPAYLFLTGLILGLLGGVAAWGLWFGTSWGGEGGRRYALALTAYYWLDFLLLTRSDAARGNWPFAIALTSLILTWVYWVLARAKTKKFL